MNQWHQICVTPKHKIFTLVLYFLGFKLVFYKDLLKQKTSSHLEGPSNQSIIKIEYVPEYSISNLNPHND